MDSVINVKINENDEIEYVNLERSTADAGEQPDGDNDDQIDDDAAEHATNGTPGATVVDDAIEHDPGAVHDAAMEGRSEEEDDDDDERNTVLVPNDDGSMTIKRKAKLIIEHVCGKCNKSYKSMASLKRHLNLCRHVPSNPKVAQQLKKKLNRSVTSTSLADLKPDECFCCFEDKSSAHVGFIACNFCPKTFKSHINLERHLFTLHAPGTEFGCTVCNAQCASESIFQLHMESHEEGKPFACDKCGKEFTRKYHLDRHLEYTECDPNRPKQKLPCNVCSKEFTRLDNLREHLRSHMGQAQRRKDYQCPYCEKSFFGSSLLNIHIRTHTGERPFPCDLCTNWFPSNGALRKHRRTHTGEKPYECSVCGKCFSVKETLNRHMKIHTGDRKHACTHCDKTFIQAQQLRAHLFYHTGENGHDCDQCTRRFNKRSRLDAHVKKVHVDGKLLTCDVCQEQFRFKGKLTVHLRKHIRDAKLAASGRLSDSPVRVKKEKAAKVSTVKIEKNAAALEVLEEEHYIVDEPEGDEVREEDTNPNDVRLAPVEKHEEDEEVIVPDVLPGTRRSAVKRQAAATVETVRAKRQTVKVKEESVASRPLKTASIPADTTPNVSPPSTDSGGPFKCDHCERVFTRRGPLSVHLKSHVTAAAKAKSASATDTTKSPGGAKKSSAAAPSVRKSSPVASSTSAVAATIPVPSTVTCKVCKKQLNNLNSLVRHMKANHRKFFMQMFADNGDDGDDDDANDDGNSNDGDGGDDDDADAGNATTGGADANSDDTAVNNQESAAHAEDKTDDDDEYEVELIPMKEEDDDESQALAVTDDAAAAAAAGPGTVEELPDGLSTAQLTEHVGKLLALLVDEQTLVDLGWPAATCEHVLSGVIEQCGQRPADTTTCPDYASVMRENAKMLFTSVISNDSIRSLLNNHTVDEVIVHVLKMAN